MPFLTELQMLQELAQRSKLYPPQARSVAAALEANGWIVMRSLPPSRRGVPTDQGFTASITVDGLQRLRDLLAGL